MDQDDIVAHDTNRRQLHGYISTWSGHRGGRYGGRTTPFHPSAQNRRAGLCGRSPGDALQARGAQS